LERKEKHIGSFFLVICYCKRKKKLKKMKTKKQKDDEE